MSDDKVPCPFCRRPIAATALKCAHCHEFLPTAGRKPEKGISVLNTLLKVIGKLGIPLTILVLAFTFKPTIQNVLGRASHADFFGTKLVFRETNSFVGSLSPIELYYLIGCAGSYGRGFVSGWNADALKEKGMLRAFESLKEKGLIEYEFSKPSESDAKIFGKAGLSARPTERGKDFLVELGLRFDGKHFAESP